MSGSEKTELATLRARLAEVEGALAEIIRFADANANAAPKRADANAWRAHARKCDELVVALKELQHETSATLSPAGEGVGECGAEVNVASSPDVLSPSKEHVERVRQKAKTAEGIGPFWRGMMLAALNVIDAERVRADKNGLALMMIREGCAEPAKFAGETLLRNATLSPAEGVERLRARLEATQDALAQEIARRECLQTCRAAVCVDRRECHALLYDTPGFQDRIRKARATLSPAGEGVGEHDVGPK